LMAEDLAGPRDCFCGVMKLKMRFECCLVGKAKLKEDGINRKDW